jgi:DNA-nicking Smr family endonuclease
MDNESAEIIFNGECDLHHFPPQFTEELILEFIEQSKQQGLTTIRLVHGKGRSQKKMQARAILGAHPDVESFSDDRSNWGATIIILKNEP